MGLHSNIHAIESSALDLGTPSSQAEQCYVDPTMLDIAQLAGSSIDGRYHLDALIGRGSSGVVYRARTARGQAARGLRVGRAASVMTLAGWRNRLFNLF